MDFKTDIFSLYPPSSRTFNLVGTTLPTNTDIYFRAKQKELLDQYCAARLFMREIDTDDWEHWFVPDEDQSHGEVFKLIFTSYFYETALMYYNIIVDLSWTICYISAEFACTYKSQRVEFSGLKSIEEAADLLRKAENSVSAPTAEENPFTYLRIMCPEFSRAIDLITDFWTNFSDTSIRNRYNYCKHKGKPLYSEIQKYNNSRFFGIYIQHKSDDEKTQIASDVKDVQLIFSLHEAISDLQQFDDDVLFPYIKALFEELETVIKPSPMI